MPRIQIQLDADQHEALKKRVQRERISLSGAIRVAIDLWLARSDRAATIARSLASVGKFRSGRKDISSRHDAELARIYLGDSRRR
jgi:hypothetical protein